MRLAELYDRAINWPSRTGLAVALAVAVVLMITGIVLPFKKRIWLGRGLGVLGFCIFMAALFTLREQEITEKPSENIIVKRYRCSERTRSLLLVTMTGLPCAALAVMWSGYVKVRHKLRSEVPRHLKAGRRYLVQKQYDAALRECNLAIQAAPQLAEAYCRRGVVYQAMGKMEQALADFEIAIGHDHLHAAARLERGKMNTESGDLDAALADFGQIMLIRADDPEIYLRRGMCLMKKGLLDEALGDFQRVLKLTNHSDFAEPAKDYIRQLENQGGRPPLPSANGGPALPSSPQPRAQDHAI